MPSPEELVVERHTQYRGIARVLLNKLDIDSDIPDKALELKNVQRIQQIFELEGCNRLEPEHFVPVLISSELLARSLTFSGINEQQLRDPRNVPQLRIAGDARLRVLHGRHRLSAARNFLPQNDKWWTVEIFEEGLSEQLKNHILYRYQNEQAISDGHIYRHLRDAQLVGDDIKAGRWLARLSKAKQRDVALLHKHEPALTAALASLLPFIGLWSAVQLGTLRRILGLQCSPEMVRYVQNIRRIWRHIMLDDEGLTGLLDPFTVSQVETLHPTMSNSDKKRLYDMMQNYRIFTYIMDVPTRNRILNRLMQLDEPILSLHTFLEDTKLLEVATKPLKRLLAQKFKNPLCEEFRNIHSSAQEYDLIPVQTSDIQSVLSLRRFSISSERSYYPCYLQLVLYCIRYFYALTEVAPRRERGQKHLDCPEENAAIAFADLARLAKQLGFSSDPIRELANMRPEESASVAFLSELRPIDRADISTTARTGLVRDIASRIRDIHWIQHNHGNPLFTTNLVELEKSHRIGRPFTKSYRFDRTFTFLDTFYATSVTQPAEHLTTLAVRRYTFIAFYGNVELLDANTVAAPAPHEDGDRTDEDSMSATSESTISYERHDDLAAHENLFVDTNIPFNERVAGPASSVYSMPSRGSVPNSPSARSQLSIRDSVNREATMEVVPGQPMRAIGDPLAEFAINEFCSRSPSHITVIHCDTARYVRVKSEQLADLVIAAANMALAFATMNTASDVERQDVKRVRGAAIRDRVVFLYEKRRENVYAYHELRKFLDQFN